MKPILVDGLYINMGGALTVLNRLIDGLAECKVPFVLIKDKRCPKLHSEQYAKNIVLMNASMRERYLFYKKINNEYQSILCMANIPPTRKMPCHVSTYFHNLSIIQPGSTLSIKRRFSFYLKKQYISFLSGNTDDWIIQTWNTENKLKKHIPTKDKKCFIYPIYTIPTQFDVIAHSNNRNDYLFIGDYTFAKGHDTLIEAWEKLFDRGIYLYLHLTVTRCQETESFCNRIDELTNKGVPIINHGVVPFSEVVNLYKQAKAIVYPSLEESLGLGIVEGISAGCDVITSDLDYAHSICEPSEVFDPHDSDSIMEAVIRYERGQSPKSILTIRDHCMELINHMCR